MATLPSHRDDATRLLVEIAIAFPTEQVVLALAVNPGATAHDVLIQSGLMQRFPTAFRDDWALGIFSKKLDDPSSYVVCEGDRVEVYRPLLLDPQTARRQRAAKARQQNTDPDSNGRVD